MNFFDIKPNIRFARFLTLDKTTNFPAYIPYDCRLFYTMMGSSTISVAGRELVMDEGSLLVINSGIEYQLHHPDTSVTYAAFNFDYTYDFLHLTTPVPPDVSSIFNQNKIIGHTSFDNFSSFNSYVYIKNIKTTKETLTEIISEYTNNLIGNKLKMSCLMTDVLVECSRKIEFESASPENLSKEVINYIHENYNKPLTNMEIGKLFHLHPNYISKLIKRCTGMPLHKYLLNIRLTNAIKLLELGRYSISEVAEKCGFCDLYYFSRYFKSEVKTTPSDYMRKTSKKW